MKGFTLRALALGAVLGLVAGVAGAQPSFTDEKIEAFGEAVERANAVAQSWRPRVEAARDADEQQRLVEMASTEIADTIAATEGITLGEYEAIVVAIRSDAGLARRVQEELRERDLAR